VKNRSPESLKLFQNDFESLMLDAFPKVKNLKTEFVAQGAVYSLMSGSGGAVFGIFEKEATAKKSYEVISKKYPTSFTPPNFVMT
jgi:4-diphosphocytidyl-2-C-methyl-D-erythritol kinase